jgi:hypothetical protein
MNQEKIKELAKQAGYLPDMFGVGHWDMPEFKRFAELIIEECAGVCSNATAGKGMIDLVGRGFAEEIKLRFGVDQ